MSTKEIINQRKLEFNKILEFYKSNTSTIRTGRATPALVEDIEVDYFNQKYQIKELASISAPEPRTVMIQPWDKGAVEAISGAIRKSDLGLNPVVDGQIILLKSPP